jgi:hypothetical protein
VSARSSVERQRPRSVQQDWVAWLPNETAQAFEQLQKDLAVSCILLGVVLNEALGSDASAATTTAELAVLFSGLFDRMVLHLGTVLRAIEECRAANGTSPNALPLQPGCFRSPYARQIARTNRLRSAFSVRGRSAFGLKLSDIRRVIAVLQSQARQEANEIAGGRSRHARTHWARLEVLQYDLNTCLQETTIVLKSFFCAVPGRKLPLFPPDSRSSTHRALLLAGRPPGF